MSRTTIVWALAALVGLAAPAASAAEVAPGAPAPVSGRLDREAALRLALQRNPALAAAVLELERARLRVKAEESRYEPSLTASVGYTRSANPSLTGENGAVRVGTGDSVAIGLGVSHTFALGTSLSAQLDLSGSGRTYVQPGFPEPLSLGPDYSVGLRLGVTQPLLRGLGTDVGEAELRVARLSQQAARSSKVRAASEVARDVLSAYWEVWYAQASVEIQKQGLEVAQKQLDDAMLRVKAGAMPEVEALPLRTQVAQLQEAVMTATVSVNQRRVELARLTGAALGGAASEALSVAPDEPVVGLELPAREQVAKAAADNAYELIELAATVEQARVQVLVASDATKPSLNANAWVALQGLGYQDPGAAFEMFGTFGAVSGYVGLELALPIVNTYAESEAERARVAVKVAERRLQDATERVEANAVSQLEAWRAAEGRVTFAQETARLSALAAEGEKDRFDAGAGTALELVVAEQNRREAELRVARAQADAAVARANLAHTTGELLDDVAPALK